MVGIFACASTPREISSEPARGHMRPYRYIVGKTCYATSGFAGLPSTLQIRESLTEAEIGDPMEETGT